MKKLTAIILTLALTLSLLPASAGAVYHPKAKMWESNREIAITAGEEYNIALWAAELPDYDLVKYRLSYDSSSAEIVDACAFTTEKELEPGAIDGNDITIDSIRPGEMQFYILIKQAIPRYLFPV